LKATPEFDRFNPEIADFFAELSKNNSKEWFDANRKFYEKEIKDKSKLFIGEMGKRPSGDNLPYISDPKVSMFRINRDIRFSKNKDPYKTNLGFWFPYGNDVLSFAKKSLPGLYFHFSNEESFIACGIHMPESADLKKIRAVLANDFERFESITGNKKFKAAFPKEMTEGSVTRVQGYSNDHPAFKHIAKKEHTYFIDTPIDSLFSPELADILIEKAKISNEFHNFLHTAITD
jgi:uncharacterized protein (TIGR02453 family)